MDLTQLEMFNAVALTGSITQAAAKVHRVPSNLTTRIRQLEADLGVSLFIRENQRLRLSPAGHNFLRYSQQILALVDEARMVVAGEEPQGLNTSTPIIARAIPANCLRCNRSLKTNAPKAMVKKACACNTNDASPAGIPNFIAQKRKANCPKLIVSP